MHSRAQSRAPRSVVRTLLNTIQPWRITLLIGALLFLLTLGVGLWAAYDRPLALVRFTLLAEGLLGSLVVSFFSRRERAPGLQLATWLGGAVGLLFLLYHPLGATNPQDFAMLPQLTSWLEKQQPGWENFAPWHENQVAAALIVLLPLGVGACWQSLTAGSAATGRLRGCLGQFLTFGTLLQLLIGSIALVLTFSRGAWLGLGFGVAIAGYLYWRSSQRRRTSLMRTIDLALLSSAGVLISGLVILTLRPALITTLALGGSDASMISRPVVWHDALTLIGDYPFTGSGLGNTAMVLSSYVYLLHVPYLHHVHNLYLQVAVEQGLPGLIAFITLAVGTVGMAIVQLRQGAPASRKVTAGALAAQLALLLHGCVDAELYVGSFAGLLWLPAAVLVMLALPQSKGHQIAQRRLTTAQRFAVASVPFLALSLLALWPGAQSRWLTNLTAVEQTRQELSLYEWPTWSIQDEVRRSPAVETDRFIAEYGAALAHNQANVTAHRRLGQLLLAQGNYEQALRELTGAYRLAPTERATRQLLGEAYALTGNDTQAVALWRTVDVSQGQLDLRHWWHQQVDQEISALHFTEAMQEAGIE